MFLFVVYELRMVDFNCRPDLEFEPLDEKKKFNEYNIDKIVTLNYNF